MNSEGAHGSPTVLPLLNKIRIENNTTDKTLGQLLAEGAIDATLGSSLPNEIRTNPDVVRLFPDYVDVDKGLYKRKKIYQCLEPSCKQQFSATSGTIFNDSHLPLNKWFLAVALLVDAKKGMSAKQVQKRRFTGSRWAH